MRNPYQQGTCAFREYAAGFACGMGNAAAGYKSKGSVHWSDAYKRGYYDGHEWESSRGKR